MVKPIYVPVLPARPRGWKAYEALHPRLQRRIAPLWTVVPYTGPERPRAERVVLDPDDDPTVVEGRFTSDVDGLLRAVGGRPGWVDAAHVEGRVRGAATGLWRLATRSGLRLVTGPERDRTLQRYSADLAFLSGRGLGIRLLVDEPPDERCSAELQSMVSRLCLVPSRTDLILDMGAVMDGDETVKDAIAALDLLGTLLPWRMVVLTSGAFPRFHEERGRLSAYEVRRHDLDLDRAVRRARPGLPGSVVYGDYSVEHVSAANIPPGDDPYGPPWGLLRYTTHDSYLIARAPMRGREHVERVRATARWITEAGGFRGAEYGDGERWLHECAAGEGAKGSGNPETWIRVGHLQHMAFAVNQLSQGG
ncbi:hypothetical protein [Streptomyces sp. NPDC047061]|uniref:beta family protein n=1 Tax=Streptomyces sp. NPDC047061 TaxID=3154605 RepID=UPI0033CDDACA